MSGIGLLQPDVCEVQLAHDHDVYKSKYNLADQI